MWDIFYEKLRDDEEYEYEQDAGRPRRRALYLSNPKEI